ncbi:MAG: hypothetical protein ACFHHU_00930 [Porticoccaceae bacterium]
MKIKLFHELDRAAQSDDKRALEIFRKLTNQLREGGLSWVDVPVRITQSIEVSPRDVPSAVTRSNTIRSIPEAAENIGPHLLKIRDILQHTHEEASTAWQDIEQQWLQDGRLSEFQFRDLQTWLPDLTDKQFIGRAKTNWLNQHRETLLAAQNRESTEARECLIDLQSTRNELIEQSRHTLLEFVTAANTQRALLVSWATLLERIGEKGSRRDMSALLQAAEGSGDNPGTLAICLIQDLSPSCLDIPTPTIATARKFLTVKGHQTAEEFLKSTAPADNLSRYSEAQNDSGVLECIAAAKRHRAPVPQ